MENENKRFNPYIIIIIILIVVITGFIYDRWGKGILPASVNETKKTEPSSSGNIDVATFEGDIIVGNKDAPVTMVEYYSYLCGYCKLFEQETKPKITENYISTGKVKYIFRPFPPYELGQAVLCANDQGKFLEYHNALFENSGIIKKSDDLKKIAKDTGLDETQFNQCFDSQKYLAKAQEWYQEGKNDFENAGLPENQRGTPAFFINGQALIGAQPYDKFVEVIERKLSE